MGTLSRAQVVRSATGLLAAAGGALLAGCRGQAAGTDSSTSPTRKSGTIRIDRDTYNPSQGRVIDFWLDLWRQRFPEIRLELRAGVDGAKMVSMLAADEHGELIDLNAGIYPHYKGQPGLLVDINPALRQKKINVNDYFDIPEITTFRDKRFGLLYRPLVFGWLYNRGLFESKSVPLPTEAWTYDDMLDHARRLTDLTASERPTYGVQLSPIWNIFPLFRAAGIQYISSDFSKTTWETPQAITMLQWLLDAIHKHRVAPSPQTITDRQISFNDGNAAMREGSTGSKATQRSIGDRIRWENAWPPTWKATGRRSLLVDGNAWHVTGKAQQADLVSEVVDLIMLWFGPEVQDQNLVHEGFGMPASKKVATDPRFAGPPPESLKIVPQMWDSGQTYHRIVGGREWLGELGPLLTSALNGEMSAGELGKRMTEVGNAVLGRVTVPPWGRF
jgi:multiple sugar transport system substrate-binding protein